MENFPKIVAGPGPRTLAQIVYEPRSDKPNTEDFDKTVGDPVEAWRASHDLAHELVHLLAHRSGVTPMTAVYALAHAFADVSLSIGGETTTMGPIESIAEVGMPALFRGLPEATAQKLLAATIDSVSWLYDGGRSVRQEFEQARERATRGPQPQAAQAQEEN